MLSLGLILRGIFLGRNYATRMPEKVFVLLIGIVVFEVANLLVLNSMMFSKAESSISDGASKVFHMQIRHFYS